ncbi:MAG TPA: hypothetical protein DEA47_03885 [Peptococcaceae bacterium]|nr:hypothetical protein [Peptococcaceae bacterium]
MFVRVLLKKSKGTITTPEVMVLPNFWNDCLHTHLYCILTIPMGYIITAAVKMAFLVICFFVHKKIGGVDLRGQSSH